MAAIENWVFKFEATFFSSPRRKIIPEREDVNHTVFFSESQALLRIQLGEGKRRVWGPELSMLVKLFMVLLHFKAAPQDWVPSQPLICAWINISEGVCHISENSNGHIDSIDGQCKLVWASTHGWSTNFLWERTSLHRASWRELTGMFKLLEKTDVGSTLVA